MAWKFKAANRPSKHGVGWRDPDGRSRTKTFKYAADRDDALREIEGYEARGEVWLDPKERARIAAGNTIGALFSERHAERELHGFATSTLDADASRYASMIAPTFTTATPGEVTVDKVRRWRITLERRDLSRTHIDKAMQLLGSLLEIAVLDGTIESNPVKTVRATEHSRPRGAGDAGEHPADKHHPLTMAETVAIAAHMVEPHTSLILVTRMTGARIAETFGIRRNRIDLDAATLTFDAQIERRGRRLGPLKSEASMATVPISPETVAVFRDHLDRYPAVGDALTFTNRRGAAIGYKNWLDRHWNPAVEAAALVDQYGRPIFPRPHDLRRGFGADLARNGVPLKMAQRLMRHGDVSVTAKLYSEIGVEDLRGALPTWDFDSAARHERDKVVDFQRHVEAE